MALGEAQRTDVADRSTDDRRALDPEAVEDAGEDVRAQGVVVIVVTVVDRIAAAPARPVEDDEPTRIGHRGDERRPRGGTDGSVHEEDRPAVPDLRDAESKARRRDVERPIDRLQPVAGPDRRLGSMKSDRWIGGLRRLGRDDGAHRRQATTAVATCRPAVVATRSAIRSTTYFASRPAPVTSIELKAYWNGTPTKNRPGTVGLTPRTS